MDSIFRFRRVSKTKQESSPIGGTAQNAAYAALRKSPGIKYKTQWLNQVTVHIISVSWRMIVYGDS